VYDEGVIKFEVEHTRQELDGHRYGSLACKLIAWREVMSKLGLVGQDPARYGGAGYGNVSARVGPASAGHGRRAMLITGTQTGGRPRLALRDLCLVERYDDARNWVRSVGLIQPSSEAMTHGAIYDLSPAIRFVYHAHCPVIWRQARALAIPATDPSVPYGTPAMAQAARQLYASSTLSATRILAMGGHEDGIIVFGENAAEAGSAMVRYLARAYELSCLS